jgi:hypothetical protein
MGGWRIRLTSLPSVSQMSRKCGSLDILQACGPPWPVTGIALPPFFLPYTMTWLSDWHLWGRVHSIIVKLAEEALTDALTSTCPPPCISSTGWYSPLHLPEQTNFLVSPHSLSPYKTNFELTNEVPFVKQPAPQYNSPRLSETQSITCGQMLDSV